MLLMLFLLRYVLCKIRTISSESAIDLGQRHFSIQHVRMPLMDF